MAGVGAAAVALKFGGKFVTMLFAAGVGHAIGGGMVSAFVGGEDREAELIGEGIVAAGASLEQVEAAAADVPENDAQTWGAWAVASYLPDDLYTEVLTMRVRGYEDGWIPCRLLAGQGTATEFEAVAPDFPERMWQHIGYAFGAWTKGGRRHIVKEPTDKQLEAYFEILGRAEEHAMLDGWDTLAENSEPPAELLCEILIELYRTTVEYGHFELGGRNLLSVARWLDAIPGEERGGYDRRSPGPDRIGG